VGFNNLRAADNYATEEKLKAPPTI